jgi:hypothetical protein
VTNNSDSIKSLIVDEGCKDPTGYSTVMTTLVEVVSFELAESVAVTVNV